jgi:hypothetical protein
MRAVKAILISFFFFLAIFVYKERSNFFFSFSPQALVDPQTLTEEFDPSCKEAVCDNKKVLVPEKNQTGLSRAEEGEVAAAETSNSNKRIEIDLTNQRLYAFEGDSKVFDFLVSTGKFNRTPTGRFRIWTKLRYTKMSGGSKALGTYYYLPNVPYTMYFYNEEYSQALGYGIHGTYWHNNFGHPMSHGCVNMKTPEAEKLYYWAQPNLNDKGSIRATEDNPGTEIVIYGAAPKS